MEFIVLDIRNIDPIKKQAYALLAEPRFRCCLEGKSPDDIKFSKQVAIGFEVNGIPKGLALASYFETVSYSEVHTMNVADAYQTPETLTKLLREIEDSLFSLNSTFIAYRFFSKNCFTDRLLPILEKEGWAAPQLKMIRYFFDCKTFHPPWYGRLPPLPKGYTEFSWGSIGQKELEQIKQDEQQGHFTAQVSPFLHANTIEPINSMGLLYKGQVVGWMICHRIAPDTIQYTALFVKAEYCFRGCPLRLLADAIRLQQKSTVKWSLFELNLEMAPLSWIHFVQKRLAPFALDIVAVYETWKPASL